MEHTELKQISVMTHAPPASAALSYRPEAEAASCLNVQELTGLMPYLHRYACSLTHDADRAADLVQDTVERGLRKSHLFDGSNLRSWLTTICKRVFLNNIRREKVRRYDICIEDAPANQLCVTAEQDNQMHFADVAAALTRLTESERLIISLCGVTGMKYREIAERLSIPVGTVRSRISRARFKLSRLVEDGVSPAATPASIARPHRSVANEISYSGRNQAFSPLLARRANG